MMNNTLKYQIENSNSCRALLSDGLAVKQLLLR